jgi:hypothetical protein
MKDIPHFTQRTIEKAVYKTLCSFDRHECIKLSEFLKRLEVEKFIKQKQYKKFSNIEFIKSAIFQKLKHIKFQTRLVNYLKNNEMDALNLGFYRDVNNKILIPNQRTFSYFIKHLLDNESKDLIDFIVKKLEIIVEKAGTLFDDEIYIPKKHKATRNKFAKQYLEEKERIKLYGLCKDILMPCIKFPYLHHNTKYKMTEFIQLLVHMSLNQDFAEGGAESFLEELKRMGKQRSAPKGETLLYHIKKYDEESLQNMFIEAFDAMFKFAKKRTKLFNGRKFDVAMDETEIRYWGDENDPMVVARQKKKPESTKWCFRFITISIVNKGRKFVLLTLPVNIMHLVTKYKTFEKLINFAKERIKINCLFADRAFSMDSKFLDLVNKLGVKYCMIGFRTSKMKDTIAGAPFLPFSIKGFPIRDVKTNLLIVNSRKDKFKLKKDGIEFKRISYITNINFDNRNQIQLQFWTNKLEEYYKKRWNIETTFRDLKKFLARTTTKKHYQIRYFYWLFAVSLYNLWILAESLLSLTIYGKILKNKTSIKSIIFVNGLFRVLMGIT